MVQDPDFSLELQRFRGSDPKRTKWYKMVQISIFVGHCPLKMGQRPILHHTCTISVPRLYHFFGTKIWD